MITLIKLISGLELQHLHWDGIHGNHVPTVRFPRPSLLGWRRILTLACYLGTPSAKLGVTGKKSSLRHMRFSTLIQISSGQSYCWATFVVRLQRSWGCECFAKSKDGCGGAVQCGWGSRAEKYLPCRHGSFFALLVSTKHCFAKEKEKTTRDGQSSSWAEEADKNNVNEAIEARLWLLPLLPSETWYAMEKYPIH